MTDAQPLPQVPRLRFSHIGLNVENLPRMEEFYTRVLGFTVTDRGNAVGLDLVFLSRDPLEHHQIVLGSGKPPNLPRNTVNPMFPGAVNQISMRLDSLGDLRRFAGILRQNGVADVIAADHGTGWSLYFDDPEANKLEAFVDSDWYVEQPVFEPLDLDLPDDAIRARSLALCQAGQGFMPISDWRARIGAEMARRLPGASQP